MISSLRRLACACLVAALPAWVGATSSVRLDDLTSREVADAIRAGRTTILVPIGGTEQNGAHMALGKHNRRVALLAERIADALGDALVAPVIAYVPEGAIDAKRGHMRYAGTVSIAPDAFANTLEAAARSFRLHGFRDIVFLGDSGSYQREIATVAQRLNRRWAHESARAHALPEYYRAAADAYPKLLQSKGFGREEIGTHAGLADTALMLALDATLVRDARADRAGVDGDPRRATAELGRLGVDLIVHESTLAIRRAIAHRASH